MADNSSILDFLKGVNPADAIPFGAATTPEGSTTALSGMLGGIMSIPKKLVQNSQHSLDTGTYDPKVPMEAAMSLAGMGAPAAEAGAAGIFGGKLARTADLKALQEAEQMRMGGKYPASVWGDTGWFRSPMDSKWRFEIPDNKMALKYMPNKEGERVFGSVDSLVSHPELKKAYPELFDYNMSSARDFSHRAGTGSFDHVDPIIADFAKPYVEVNAPNMGIGRSVAAHELQHGVQNLEGFTYGSNPSAYAQALENDMRNSSSGMRGYDFNKIKSYANDYYYRTAGEVEARNVQDRLDFSPHHRSMVTPWESQSVPYDQQLLIEALKGYK